LKSTASRSHAASFCRFFSSRRSHSAAPSALSESGSFLAAAISSLAAAIGLGVAVAARGRGGSSL
jgi:hypothetical protein